MKNVIVVGLGKSGLAVARLLGRRGDRVLITEQKDDEKTRLTLQSLFEEGAVQKGDVELGSHTKDFVKSADLMVVSPGVRHDSLPVETAREENIPIIGEMELAYSMCPAPIIAVTGTSGKTTVTTLIGKILSSAGIDAIVCGNIGNPMSGEINRIKKDSIVVLEVSSFQLENIRTFKPRFSVILNVSENHLDRHKDMEEYINLKAKIFSNQEKDGIVFLNGKDNLLRQLSLGIRKPRTEFFDEYKNFGARYSIKNENYLAAMSIASAAGVEDAKMLEVISSFRGIEHRLEYVTTINGIDFINDSKATTVSSVEWALKSLEKRIILIMGGRYKGGDFARLGNLVKEKVDFIIAIGEAKVRIREALKAFKGVSEEKTIGDAVEKAFKTAKEGDKVLLSPGCSSFDMFESYEERGRIFKELCMRLG